MYQLSYAQAVRVHELHRTACQDEVKVSQMRMLTLLC